jgi:hypothetical protein
MDVTNLKQQNLVLEVLPYNLYCVKPNKKRKEIFKKKVGTMLVIYYV